MNIGIGKFIRDGFTLASLESAFRRLVAQITAGWDVQHREDGTHKDVTVDTITVADVDTDGNWTGSLIPTTATQDIGGTIARTTTDLVDRPVRNLRLSGTVTWGTFGDSVSLGPSLSRSGATLTFDTGATGTWVSTARDGVNVTTLTVDGLNGVTSSKNFFATTFVQATTYLGGSQLRITDGITAPGAQTGVAVIYVDTADGDLKVVFADGTVKTIATDT